MLAAFVFEVACWIDVPHGVTHVAFKPCMSVSTLESKVTMGDDTDAFAVQVLWAHAQGLPSQAYSALTACSNLRTLDLSFSLIPADAWRSIFNPEAQTLPHLHSLSILCTQSPISDRDLSRLVGCCPGLRSLGLKGTVEQGSGLYPLLDLTALTSLSVNHVSRNEVLGVLAELRGLQDLHISVWSSISAAGLLQLSTLRGLTRLRVESSPETWIAKYGMVLLLNKVGSSCGGLLISLGCSTADVPWAAAAALPFVCTPMPWIL